MSFFNGIGAALGGFINPQWLAQSPPSQLSTIEPSRSHINMFGIDNVTELELSQSPSHDAEASILEDPLSQVLQEPHFHQDGAHGRLRSNSSVTRDHYKDTMSQNSNHSNSPSNQVEYGIEEDSEDPTMHTGDCHVHRRFSTPLESSETTNVQLELSGSTITAGPKAMAKSNPEIHVSRSFQSHERFHDRTMQLIPFEPLAAHRYWIAVLNLNRNASTSTDTKHFTWMKGNRRTTVETVWNTFQVHHMVEDFTLFLGVDQMAFEDKMEELDLFNDKFICFRAVSNDRVPGKERGFFDDLIPKQDPPTISID